MNHSGVVLGGNKEPHRFCTRCRRFKPLSDFSPNKYRRVGLQSHCKECGRLYVRRASGAKGLSPALIESLRESQNSRCAICGELPGKRGLFIDHNHATGAVRGLLCQDCNSALGALKDQPERAIAAAEYLQRTALLLPGAGGVTYRHRRGNFNLRQRAPGAGQGSLL